MPKSKRHSSELEIVGRMQNAELSLGTILNHRKWHPSPYDDADPAAERFAPWNDPIVEFDKLPPFLSCKIDCKNCDELNKADAVLLCNMRSLANPKLTE